MFVSLFTTRLLLNSLGASDFGIFNVVGGAIAMLGFLNAAMASATQRFMSIAEGEAKPEKKKIIFNISLVLHLFIAIVLGIVLLLIGHVFFNGVLNIPEDRIYAAKVVYGGMIISTLFTVMTVPYDAVLNAHENMLYYAVVGIIESVLKLIVAFLVVYTMRDKLIIYGILMAIVSIIVMLIMRIYAHKHYEECIFDPKRYWNRGLMKEMTSFAGWNFLNNASGMISQYGLSIVLNNFYGTILNAAQGIANQISGQLMSFTNTMIKAVTPVIAKSEGAGERDYMLKTSLISSKYAFLLLAFFAVPFLIETPYILKIWLKNVPDWGIVFVRLQLIRSLTEQLTIMVGRSVEVQGDIKTYSSFRSVLNILPIVLTWLFFSLGFPPYYLYIFWILAGGVIGGAVSVYFAQIKCGLKYGDFFQKVLFPCLILITAMLIAGYIPLHLLDESFLRLCFVIAMTTLAFVMTTYFYMSKEEKNWTKELILIIKNIRTNKNK